MPASRPFSAGAPILAPGFGHQGAEPADLARCFGDDGAEASSRRESRSILAAGPDGLAARNPSASRDACIRCEGIAHALTHTHPPEVDRVAASRRAVAARRERASLKKDVAMRVITPQELLRRALADPASPAGAMRVTEFLTSIPAIGEGKRDRILHELEISPVKRLGGLGARQRRALRSFLDERWPELRAARRAQPARRARRARRPSARARSPRTSRRTTPRSTCRCRRPRGAPRPGEVDGEHYFFVDDAEFDRLDRGRRAARARDRAQPVPLRHAAQPDRDGPRRRAAPCCSRSICRARARCARPSRPRRSCSCCRRAGTNSCSGSSVAAPKDAEERARRLRTAKVELASQNEFDFRVVNDDVASRPKRS